jgi:hypothetical protein
MRCDCHFHIVGPIGRLAALGHDAAAQAIMIDKPARLYGF